MENKQEQILNALILIADYEVELLSYRGQTLFNELLGRKVCNDKD